MHVVPAAAVQALSAKCLWLLIPPSILPPALCVTLQQPRLHFLSLQRHFHPCLIHINWPSFAAPHAIHSRNLSIESLTPGGLCPKARDSHACTHAGYSTCPRRGCCPGVPRTISGRWGTRAPAAPAPSCTSTAWEAGATLPTWSMRMTPMCWKSGTWCSFRSAGLVHD